MSQRPNPTRYEQPALQVHPRRAHGPNLVVAHRLRLLAPVLRRSLQGRVQVLSQTVFGVAAVALAEALVPEVMVVDESLAEGAIEQFVPALHRAGTRLLLVSRPLPEDRSLRLLRGGVDGICATETGLDELCRDVERTAAGEVVLPAPLAAALLREWRQGGAPVPRTPRSQLTDREREVLAVILEGLSTKAIAARLGISTKTAENHKTRVFQKLGVRTQAQAITLLSAGAEHRALGGTQHDRSALPEASTRPPEVVNHVPGHR